MILVTVFPLFALSDQSLFFSFGPDYADEYFGIYAVTATTVYKYTVGFLFNFTMKNFIGFLAIFGIRNKIKMTIFEYSVFESVKWLFPLTNGQDLL